MNLAPDIILGVICLALIADRHLLTSRIAGQVLDRVRVVNPVKQPEPGKTESATGGKSSGEAGQ